MSGNCHRNCPESVRVYTSVSGKCRFFVLKNDWACYSDLFKCPEYVRTIFKNKENVRNVYGIFWGIIFSYKKNVRNVYGIFEGIIFHTKNVRNVYRNFFKYKFWFILMQKMSEICVGDEFFIQYFMNWLHHVEKLQKKQL